MQTLARMSKKKRTRDKSLILGARLRSGDSEALTQVLGAYSAKNGDERAAAKLLGIPRRTLIHWRSQVKKLDEGVRSIREEVASAAAADE